MRLGRRAWLGGAAALLLAACAAPPRPIATTPATTPATATATATADPAQGLAPEPGEGLLWRVDAAASLLQVLAFRQGALSGLGHNHVLTAPRLQGWLQLPAEAANPGALSPAQLARSRFALALRLDELQLDEAAQRARLGPAFASTPGAEAIAATRANLLGESMLEAARFPWLRVQSVQLLGEGAQLLAEIELDWHGRQRRLLLPLALQTEAGGQVLRVQGRAALRLTDFGIRPLSLLGGMLAVQDGIGVNLDLVLRPR